MSLSQGAYRVHSLFQKIIPMPYSVDLSNNQIIKSVNHQKSFHKVFRFLILVTFFLFFIPTCIARLVWLLHYWKSYTIYHVEQIVIYMFYVTATFLFLAACWTQHKKLNAISYILNQRCKLIPISTKQSASSVGPDLVYVLVKLPFFGKSSMKEILIYCLISASFVVILAVTALPFAITYDPVQLVVGKSTIPVKLIAVFVHWSITSFAATSIVSLLLMVIVFLEGILYYSTSIHFHMSPYSTWLRFKFIQCYKRYRNMQIFLIMGNDIVLEFLTSLMFIGVLLGSCGAYMTLKMYSMLNFFMYMLGPAIALLAFGLALLLTILGDFPHKHSKIFKVYWNQVVTRKHYKQILRACPQVGFNINPYGIATAKLGLHICEEIIRNTVTMLLFDVI